MSKYGGKVLTVYISPSGVRVAEGENKNGSPHISRYFIVQGVEEFFAEVLSEPGTYEISNMTGLVKAILTECKNQNTTCRRVMLCSNCFSISTEVETFGGSAGMGSLLQGDILANVKDKLGKKKDGGGSRLSPDKLSCEVKWGELVEDGKIATKATRSIGDKYILNSLVREFYQRGYEVVSIADNAGVLFNLRQTEEATFDSQGKVILDFDGCLHCIVMRTDLPLSIEYYAPMTADEIPDRVENILVSCQEMVGRNPKIYLCGAEMGDAYLYSSLIDHLETKGYIVYDMFDRPEVDPMTGFIPDTEQIPFTADFSANIAMFMSAYVKPIVTIVPSMGVNEIFRKNSKAIAAVFLVLSIGALAVTGGAAVERFLTLRAQEKNPSQVSSIQSQISTAQATQGTLDDTITTLTQSDVTVLDLINFIEYNQSEFVSVVSMDTLNMLQLATTVDGSQSTSAPEGDGIFSGTEGGGSSGTREDILLRGYARSGPAAIAYYDRLFRSGLITDPILNGVERYELPNGEVVFIFEICVGGTM